MSQESPDLEKALSGIEPTKREEEIWNKYQDSTAGELKESYGCSESNIRSIASSYRNKIDRMRRVIDNLSRQINDYSSEEYVVLKKENSSWIEVTNGHKDKMDDMEEILNE